MKASKSKSATAPAPVLCYVDGQWAYFTTRKLSEQWGDDWNDAPYEQNAGTPYDYAEHDRKEGREPWQIFKVAWDGDFEQPSEGRCNSPWSVEQINAGAVAWLHTSKWRTGKPVVIPAGATFERFCELIREGGGTVYVRETLTAEELRDLSANLDPAAAAVKRRETGARKKAEHQRRAERGKMPSDEDQAQGAPKTP